MYYHPWTTIPLMRSVVQAIESKNPRSSWACMCRCAVTLPWPQHHVMILNHPYGTYIKYVASPDINYWARVTIDTECFPIYGQIMAIDVRVWGALGGSGGPRWCRSYCHINVIYKQGVPWPCIVVDLTIIPTSHPSHPRMLSHFWRNLRYFIEGIWCVGRHMRS